MAGLPTGTTFRLIDLGLGDDVHAPEGEKQIGLDAHHAGGVGQHETGIGHVQAALRADNRQLAFLRHNVLSLRLIVS
jgi:hypothetical protein